MINPIIVQIAGNRIINSGINPKTGNIYTIDDITNEEYRLAVEEYIFQNKK